MSFYNEKDRVEIAQQQYVNYRENDIVKISEGQVSVGKVVEDINNPDTGLKAYVIQNDVGDITLLFKGSEMPGKEGWQADWLDNNLPLAGQIIHNQAKEFYQPEVKLPTPQLQASAELLKDVMVRYPEAKIFVYGHSLGSMDAQYALASVSPAQHHRIEGAWVYNGPNIYSVLTEVEQSNVDHLKHKITNYIDAKDIVGLGYPKTGSYGAVGLIKRVESRIALNEIAKSFHMNKTIVDDIKTSLLAPITWFADQHVWGGYQYNKDGSIKLSQDNEKDYNRELAFYSRKQPISDKVFKLLTDLKKSSSSNRSIDSSASKEIYLNAEQATEVAKGLTQLSQLGQEQAKTLSNALVTNLEEIYKLTHEAPMGSILSPAEVRSAFYEAGVNKERLVDYYRQLADENDQLMEELAENFSDLESQLKAGMASQVALDSELGAAFVS